MVDNSIDCSWYSFFCIKFIKYTTFIASLTTLQINIISSLVDSAASVVEDYAKHSEWDLAEITVRRNDVKYPCCNETYPDVTFALTLRRRSTFVIHLFVGPAVVLCLIIPLVFILPSGSGVKIFLGKCI